MRNHADYDGEKKFDEDYFIDFLKENQKGIEIAIGVARYFKTHPNY